MNPSLQGKGFARGSLMRGSDGGGTRPCWGLTTLRTGLNPSLQGKGFARGFGGHLAILHLPIIFPIRSALNPFSKPFPVAGLQHRFTPSLKRDAKVAQPLPQCQSFALAANGE